ncbi:MAG: 30S ribosomal protein S16 [bacterium]|jgi:small subunit ribosomal protein S16
MAVKLRLFRVGKKKQSYFRVVAKEQRSPRQGKYLEEVGFLNPHADPEEVKLNSERIRWWLEHGAEPTETVARLIKNHTDVPIAAKYLPGTKTGKARKAEAAS